MIVGKHQHLQVLEGRNETQIFDLEIRQIGELQNGGIFNIEPLDIEIVLALKEQVLVELIVEVGPAEAVLEVIHQSYLQGP